MSYTHILRVRCHHIAGAYLGELAVGEVLEQGTLAHGAVADEDQPELIVEDRLHHFEALMRSPRKQTHTHTDLSRPGVDNNRAYRLW